LVQRAARPQARDASEPSISKQGVVRVSPPKGHAHHSKAPGTQHTPRLADCMRYRLIGHTTQHPQREDDVGRLVGHRETDRVALNKVERIGALRMRTSPREHPSLWVEHDPATIRPGRGEPCRFLGSHAGPASHIEQHPVRPVPVAQHTQDSTNPMAAPRESQQPGPADPSRERRGPHHRRDRRPIRFTFSRRGHDPR
jgi:hypothetical protein